MMSSVIHSPAFPAITTIVRLASHYNGAVVSYPKTGETVEVISAPTAAGQPLQGANKGPEVLLQNGLLDQLTQLGYDVRQQVLELNPKPPKGYENASRIFNGFEFGENNRRIYDTVRRSIANGNRVLTLGGDHHIGMGTLLAAVNGDPNRSIIFIDAHADINTPDSSPSKNTHGMGVHGAINPQIFEQEPSVNWAQNGRIPRLLSPQRIVYIGLRSVDQEERYFLRHFKIPVYDMHQINRLGTEEVANGALKHLNNADSGPTTLHISWDVDAMDPQVISATGTREDGGLTYREMQYLFMRFAPLTKSLDVVEFNPELKGLADGVAQREAKRINALIGASFGATLS